VSGRSSDFVRVKATVAYDGTDYHGLQRQVNAPSVQATLEGALTRIMQSPTRILAAGRTDAGVHAEGQVIAFDTAWRHGLPVLERAMNAVLPSDVAVRDLAQVEADFHPRYDARSRLYRYTVYNAPVRSPLARHTSLHVAGTLDLQAMVEATAMIVGEHDFAAFGKPTQGEVTVRRVIDAGWRVEAPWWWFDIEANAFLYRMVRKIVGALLLVGQGRLSPDEFGAILASRDRSQVGLTAQAQGLCLIQVKY
jgi:tRNA pseudouridine38-40 synthase